MDSERDNRIGYYMRFDRWMMGHKFEIVEYNSFYYVYVLECSECLLEVIKFEYRDEINNILSCEEMIIKGIIE